MTQVTITRRDETPALAALPRAMAFLRDFVAVTALFGTLYGWFVFGSALTA